MPDIFNIYCDESCHLEHDGQPVMLLGAVRCPSSLVRTVSKDLRKIKERWKTTGEMKWVKVSPARLGFYEEILTYFFESTHLRFRCLAVVDKTKLDHSYFNKGSHDSFYYKMYFFLLRQMLSPKKKYNIYLDIKDTRSQRKIEALGDMLCAYAHDTGHEMIAKIQHIRARESELLQLTDLLLGIVSYAARGELKSDAKVSLLQNAMKMTGLSLTESTPPWDPKFNLFFFAPQEVPKGEPGETNA